MIDRQLASTIEHTLFHQRAVREELVRHPRRSDTGCGRRRHGIEHQPPRRHVLERRVGHVHPRRPAEREVSPFEVDLSRRMNLDVAVLDTDIRASRSQQDFLLRGRLRRRLSNQNAVNHAISGAPR
jgi:hypothetical protein